MVSQREKIQADPLPVPDDGWWASVLADEERFSQDRPARPARPQAAVAETPRRAGGNGPERERKSVPPPSQPAAPLDWSAARQLYQTDQIVTLKVTGHNRGGLLVEGDGIHGFVPFSHLIDMAGRGDAAARAQVLSGYVGRSLNLKVIECVPEDGRIVFSERAAQTKAGRRTQLFHSLQVGQQARGEVTNVTDFGVFIDLGGVEGLIHISELSWGRVAHPSQIAQIGQTLDVLIMELTPERCRVALSLKRLHPNPWETAERDYCINDVVPAVITSVVSYGAFARLPAGLEGLIHASAMPLAHGQNVRDLLSEGQQVQVRILHVDAAHQRLGLSLNTDS